MGVTETKDSTFEWRQVGGQVIFVLAGFANRTVDFIIITPNDLLARIDEIRKKRSEKLDIYFCVTKEERCWERRGLKRADDLAIAHCKFDDVARDFKQYLNNWKAVEALNS